MDFNPNVCISLPRESTRLVKHFLGAVFTRRSYWIYDTPSAHWDLLVARCSAVVNTPFPCRFLCELIVGIKGLARTTGRHHQRRLMLLLEVLLRRSS